MGRWGRWRGYGWAVAAAVLATVAGLLMSPRFDLVNVALVYFLAVVAVAIHFDWKVAAVASLLCVGAFDYLFVAPQGTFTVDEPQYLLTFAIMLGVGAAVAKVATAARQQAEARARLAMEAETERMRSMLLASISHDLRTPLAVISGASSSLVEGADSLSREASRELASSIYGQSREMSERVAKILHMTRLQAGEIELRRDWASVAEVVAAALAQCEERLARHHLVLEIARDLPLVRVDSTLFEVVVANLLENAARHTPSDTVVRVRANASAGELVLAVESLGATLGEDELQAVFTKFQRGARSAPGGIGLGLAICRAIVGLHGGRIWAERLGGGGTAFRVGVPLEGEPPVPPEADK